MKHIFKMKAGSGTQRKILQKAQSILTFALLFCTFAAAVFFVTAPLSGCATPPGTLYQYADTAMGTVMQFQLYTTQKESGERFSKEAMALLNALESEQLSWRLENAEIYRINALSAEAYSGVVEEEAGMMNKPDGVVASSKPGSSVVQLEISPKLAAILTRCLELWEQSGGTFDITLGAVARLWEIDHYAALAGASDAPQPTPGASFRPPTAAQITTALERTGSHKLTLQGTTLTMPAGMQLDLGAVGKGLALDELRSLLTAHNEVPGAVISAGGSILLYGEKPDHSPWKVGVIHPLDTSKTLGTLTLDGSGWCVTASGDYERYVEVDGVRYHHIIDPATGYPADGGVSGVTILSKDGLLGDMLSTACFVLGAEEGLKLVNQYEAEALFVLKDGTIILSEGMGQYFRENP